MRIFKMTQTEIKFKTRDQVAGRHGGARPGAGRKPRKGKARQRGWGRSGHDTDHQTRPAHAERFPLHVTLRVKDDVKRLRRGYVLRQLRRAPQVVARREAVFRVVHMSIQGNHLHLLVEAANKKELARGMQAFAISAARAINRAQQRTGKVFAYRYHSVEIRNRRQTRHALAYVLNNWRRHAEDTHSGGRALRVAVDPYSSGVLFDGWTTGAMRVPDGFVPLAVKAARTWMLAKGWQMYGLIAPREVPGPF
jgi:REP-associated tyrosine transposase